MKKQKNNSHLKQQYIEVSVSKQEIVRMVIFLFLFISIIGFSSYILTFGFNNFIADVVKYVFNLPLAIIYLLGGTIIHELLHVAGLIIQKEIKPSSFKFGISSYNFGPYVHCKHEVKRNFYMLSLLLPFVILGVVPFVLSFSVGHGGLFLFGSVFILAASADLVSALKLLKYNRNASIADHPDVPGFYVKKAR